MPVRGILVGEPELAGGAAARNRAVSLSNLFSVRAPAPNKGLHLPHVRLRDDTRHALPIILLVTLAGTVGVGFAIGSLASGGHG